MKDKKALEKFSDVELFDFINDRREKGLVPKVRKQIVIANKMLDLSKELEDHNYERTVDYGRNWNQAQIIHLQKHVESFIEELQKDKDQLLKDVREEYE